MPVKRLRPRGLKTQKGPHTWEVRAGRRSCPDNGFAQLQEWTDGGSALASPCGRTGQTPRQRIQHSRRTYDFPERLVRFGEISRMSWAEIARRSAPAPRPSGGGTRTASGPTPTISWPYRTSRRAGGLAICSPSERRHTRQWSLKAERIPAKAPQIAPPGANRTPGGLDIPKRDSGCRPGRTSDAMPRARTPEHR